MDSIIGFLYRLLDRFEAVFEVGDVYARRGKFHHLFCEFGPLLLLLSVNPKLAARSTIHGAYLGECFGHHP